MRWIVSNGFVLKQTLQAIFRIYKKMTDNNFKIRFAGFALSDDDDWRAYVNGSRLQLSPEGTTVVINYYGTIKSDEVIVVTDANERQLYQRNGIDISAHNVIDLTNHNPVPLKAKQSTIWSEVKGIPSTGSPETSLFWVTENVVNAIINGSFAILPENSVLDPTIPSHMYKVAKITDIPSLLKQVTSNRHLLDKFRSDLDLIRRRVSLKCTIIRQVEAIMRDRCSPHNDVNTLTLLSGSLFIGGDGDESGRIIIQDTPPVPYTRPLSPIEMFHNTRDLTLKGIIGTYLSMTPLILLSPEDERLVSQYIVPIPSVTLIFLSCGNIGRDHSSLKSLHLFMKRFDLIVRRIAMGISELPIICVGYETYSETLPFPPTTRFVLEVNGDTLFTEDFSLMTLIHLILVHKVSELTFCGCALRTGEEGKIMKLECSFATQE